MEFVAILAAVAVAVLQIITISVVFSLKKKVEELIIQKPSPSNIDREKRDRDSRPQQNNKRPMIDPRSKLQTQPATTLSASVDQVEKSLRDINLKLKNAERDQENARKKIQTSFSKDQNRRRDNRDVPRGGRDNNRDNIRKDRRGGNNWQERNNRLESKNSPEVSNRSENVNTSEKILPIEDKPILKQPNITDALQVKQKELEPSDYISDDSLQHGRKVTVKRRMLKEEDSIIENDSFENLQKTDQTEKQFSNENESKEILSEKNEAEIKFGRR